MTVTLVRHTSLAVPAGHCYGRTEVPLAATFAAEAAAVRSGLPAVLPVVWTSPAERCRRLADSFGAAAVRVDPRLHEIHFGLWENRAWNDIPRAEIDVWAADFVHRVPPGGESLAALAVRVESFRLDLVAAGSPAVVVTHAGVIRAWCCLAAGQPLKMAFERKVVFGETVSLEA